MFQCLKFSSVTYAVNFLNNDFSIKTVILMSIKNEERDEMTIYIHVRYV